MLIIVMHNNREYLDSIKELACKEGISEASVVERKGIGSALIGSSLTNFVSSTSQSLSFYDKALIVYIKGEEQGKAFLSRVENDKYLNLHNIQDRGFVCTLPFDSVKQFNKQFH